MMRGARILVVEDEPLSLDVLSKMLDARGLVVESVADGPSCVEWLERNEADLVLLDVSLPGMSGLDVLKWIRGRPETELTPVILISALIDSDAEVEGLDAGATDYLAKPVSARLLMARIGVGLRLRRALSRRIDAERHQAALEALADATGRLGAPLGALIDGLERFGAGAANGTRERGVEDLMAEAQRAKALVDRLGAIAEYRREPYTEGLGSFVTAALEELIHPREER